MTGAGRVLFLARVPAAGFAVYDIRAGDSPANALPSTLKVNERSLENDRYRVLLDENGDVASIVDKKLLRELLASPAHLEIKTDEPAAFPAWNMEWGDQMRPPRLRLKQPLRVTIVERGPARVALAVDRRGEGSRFIQTIRLAAGAAGERLEFANAIDWRTGSAHLKAVFPLAAASGKATYNLDVGTIERPGNNPKMFEMASQRWFDQTDAGGSFGVTVLSDCKYGSDKPDDRTLRLTLLRTPGARGWHAEQATQDWGHHEFVYGLAAHAGDWRRAQTDWQAYRLNQPLLAWQATRHDGPLGRSFSFLRLSRERVRVLALKKAEAGAEIVIRLVEMNGQGVAGVRVGFAAPLLSARELDGQERPVGGARVRDGELVADFGPYQLRTFALTLAPAPGPLRAPRGVPIKLAHNVRVAGGDGERSCTGFDAQGRLFPAGMFPARIVYQGVGFELATAQDSLGQATACMGQEIILPPGRFAKLLVLAAADGEQQATFRVDDKAFELAIQDWGGFIGQWDNRIWQMAGDGSASGGGPVTSPGRGKPPDSAPRVTCIGLEPGFVKPAPVAWFATHRHDAAGTDDPYAYAYMFAYELDLAAPARVLRLPDNRRIRLFAVTAVDRNGTLRPLWPAGDGLAAGIP
jgi:alpha-mannosidase